MAMAPPETLESVQVHGHSDDLIEFEGQFRAELQANYDSDTLVVLSDGTVLRLEYNSQGIWKITTEAVGMDSSVRISPAPDEHDYSDVADVETDEPVEWVAKASTIHLIDTDG